jgi:hypothetical protein
MATPRKTPPIPLPDWDTVVTKTPTVTPTVPKSVTVPTTVPKTTGPALPDWDTGGKTTPVTGSTLPVRNTADAELRGTQRDLNQAIRAAERSGVSGQTVQNITERKEPNVGLKVLGAVLNTPIIKYGVLKPLEVLDIGRRGIVGALSDEYSILEAIKDPTLSSKDAFNINTGNKVLDWTLGFTTDVLLDPVTYATFGTGGFVKAAAGGLAREGAMVTTKGIARTVIKEAGEAAVKQADDAARFTGQALDDVQRATIRESAEAAAKETEDLIVKAAPKPGTPGALAIEAAEKAQRVGPRRVIGARSREELAQGAREVRDIAVQSGNDFVAKTLTDDVIGDLATRGYSAARGDVARALGLRGGIRWGVGPAKVILPGTERIADTFGQVFTGLRVGAKTPLNDLPYLRNSLSAINKGFVGTRLGSAVLRNTTPIGEGGLFGSEDILRMRTALRSGKVSGREITGAEANDFVKLLSEDRAYRGLKAAAETDANQLLRPLYASKEFNKYANSVSDLVDNPVIGENLATITAADASNILRRPVDEAELKLAQDIRKVGDEFQARANDIYQRGQLMAGRTPEELQELPKNRAWFPHTLSQKAGRALADNKIPAETLEELGVDRTFALAGSNLRQLKVGSPWFGKKLTQADINGGVKRLNEIARPTLGYDFFETNAQRAFEQYGKGFARDTSYSNFLYNMSLATEARRGLTDTPLGQTAEAFGGGLFAGKGFEGDITQEPTALLTGVKAPKKIESFIESLNDVLSPSKVAALDTVPAARKELENVAVELAALREGIEKSKREGTLLFSDSLNQTFNDLEQRIFDLQRIAPEGSLPSGYGSAISSEANALMQSLKNEADGLRLVVSDIDPKKWANTVPLFVDSANRFLQLNAINYPGLIGSPEVTELLQNVKRLEDPAVARAMQKALGPMTNMFKGWVTATPGFHVRNGLSNAFFLFSAGANPANIGQAARIYTAYTKFLKRQGLYTKVTPEGAIVREGVLGPSASARTARQASSAPPEVFENKTILDFLASKEAEGLGLDRSVDGTNTLVDILTQVPTAGYGQIGDILTGTGRLGITGREVTGDGVAATLSRGAGKPLGLSRRVGNTVETWSRFALLYDGVKQGLSPEASAARASKYLIDYSDLSRADQVIKQFIPFWMWTSRSFPLILESSWANPRAYAVWNNVTRNMRDEEADAEQTRPSYLQPAIPVGGNVLFNPDFGFQRSEEGFANLADPSSILAGLTPALRLIAEIGADKVLNTGKGVTNPYFEDPKVSEAKYILQSLFPQLGAVGRATNAGIGATQAAGQAAGAAGQQDLQAILEQIAAAPQTQLPESIRGALGVGKPAYIQEEQGTLTPEESRQRLLSFFGIPVTQLQPWQQTAAIKQIIERLEQETTRAKEEREKQRRNK